MAEPHYSYSDATEYALDQIPDSLRMEQKMMRVYELQAKAVNAFAESGNRLRNPGATSYDEWVRIFTEEPWF